MSKYNVIKKSKNFMKDYIAVHGHLPKNELPVRMRNMRYNSIYIRSDKLTNRLTKEEHKEMRLMENGLTYKQAHRIAHRR